MVAEFEALLVENSNAKSSKRTLQDLISHFKKNQQKNRQSSDDVEECCNYWSSCLLSESNISEAITNQIDFK